MKKEYWIIVISYIAMQLSTLIGVPIVMFFGKLLGYDSANLGIASVVIWLIFSFLLTLLVVLFLLRHEMKNPLRENSASIPASIGWAVAGIFLSLVAQSIAGSIEMALGIEQESENTQQLMTFVEYSPLVIVVISVVGPILEEIVFRKIIFGALYKRLGFFLSALISSLVFAAAHMEFVHILLYASMGFTFAFLYVRTKRIWVPILAHVSMNTLVVIIQFNLDAIQEWQQNMENISQFIGGFL